MNDYLDFKTYLFISSKKLIIFVNTKTNKQVYFKELIHKKKKDLDLDELDHFLNENIFKIEKLLKNFVKKIDIILKLDIFFTVEVSIKKNDLENSINLKNLNYLLNEAKYSLKKTIDERRIVHMLIKNYNIDNKNYPNMPKELTGIIFSIDVKFICLSQTIIKDFEKVLKKYQISLSQIVSADYIQTFLDPNDNEKEIFFMANKIMDGLNPNEVKLTFESKKKQGFFEKFFNFFS